MIPNSLRFRLLGAEVAIILLAVQAAGLMVLVLFERNVISIVHNELDSAVDQLAASLSVHEDGKPSLGGGLPDVRFRQRLAGRYWQVSANDRPLFRSPSLGDGALRFNAPAGSDRYAWKQPVMGPDQQKLYASVRRIVLEPASHGQPARCSS